MLGLVADYASGDEDEDHVEPAVGFSPMASVDNSLDTQHLPQPDASQWFQGMPVAQKRKKRVIQLAVPASLLPSPADDELQELEQQMSERRARRQQEKEKGEGDLSWLPPPKRVRREATSEKPPQTLQPPAVIKALVPPKTIKPARFTFSTTPTSPSAPVASVPASADPMVAPQEAVTPSPASLPPDPPQHAAAAIASTPMPEHLVTVMRQVGASNLVDISAADLMGQGGVDAEAKAYSAMQSAKLQRSHAAEQPSKLMRRKHQIGFLSHQAELDEVDVDVRVAHAYKSKGSTAAKYGW